ncbi:MAG: EAL domain-containing protein [Pseudomonadota bacterium]
MSSSNSSNDGSIIALKIVFGYFVLSVLWIAGSDQLLKSLVSDVELLISIQMMKGWFFVTITAAWLYWLIKRYMRALSETNQALGERDAHLTRLNSIHSMLSASNGAILRIRDPNELLNEACRIAVDIGEFRMAWVALLDAASDEVKCAAHAGIGRRFIEQVTLTQRDDQPEGQGLIGRVFREGKHQVADDIETDARMTMWAADFAALQIHSAAAFPLRVQGRVVGVLALYADQRNFFNQDGMRLLDEVAADVSLGLEHIETTRQLDYLAYYDPLTALPNRRLFEDRLRQAMAVAHRNHFQFAVLVIEIRDLGEISDTFGRHVGDRVLQECAARLNGMVRESDSLSALSMRAAARMSGHEFGLLISETAGVANAQAVATRLRTLLSQSIAIDEDENVAMHVRIGIALYPEHGDDAVTLLRNAELAVHTQQQKLPESCVIYSTELNHLAQGRRDMERALRQASELGEFFLEYQPKVQAVTGKVVGAEALLRWQRPQVGVVAPNLFISMLEETGLIIPVGRWVIQEACNQYRRLVDHAGRPITLAINISVKQLAAPQFIEEVAAILKTSDVAPEHIEFEITESSLAENAQVTLEILHALKGLGVRLAIDDFGTGYSSLSYLRHFPLDTLKIDRSFVRDIVQNPEAHCIARTVIALAASLRLDVVAEGVETASQLGMLLKEGCGVIQGYFFSQPLALDALLKVARGGFPVPALQSLGSDPRPTLLILDDEPAVIAALKRVLSGEDYTVLGTTDPDEAFAILATHRIAVLLCDLRMPGISGTEFLRRAKQLHPDTARLILSGYTDLKTVTEAVNTGFISKFLSKPWQDDDLRTTLREVLRAKERGLSESPATVPGPRDKTAAAG